MAFAFRFFQQNSVFPLPQEGKSPHQPEFQVFLAADRIAVVVSDQIVDGSCRDGAAGIRTGETAHAQIVVNPDREVEREAGLAKAASTRSNAIELGSRKFFQTEATELQ